MCCNDQHFRRYNLQGTTTTTTTCPTLRTRECSISYLLLGMDMNRANLLTQACARARPTHSDSDQLVAWSHKRNCKYNTLADFAVHSFVIRARSYMRNEPFPFAVFFPSPIDGRREKQIWQISGHTMINVYLMCRRNSRTEPNTSESRFSLLFFFFFFFGSNVMESSPLCRF